MKEDDEPNIFQAPIADSDVESVRTLTGYQPEGAPHPIILAWIGVGLAIGVIASLFAGFYSWVPALTVVPVRLIWVVYARVQMRRHESTWSPGTRSFLLSIWIINILILCLDGLVILLFTTCLLAYG